jgi:predicted TPR repeat methyltransferase
MRVTGVDAAAAMIKQARERYPQATWQQADMRSLELKRKFRAIVAWDSFFHLTIEEQERMFPIFRSHLLEDGALVFTSGPERGEAIGDMNGNPLYHASLSRDEYRALLKANGMEEVSYHPKDRHCGDHTIWLCRMVPEP